VRGFRIEPGEIEAALTRHPAVAQAAVIAREDQPGNKRLVAYVVVKCRRACGCGRAAGASGRAFFPTTWCRRGLWFWIICRSRRTASSTGVRCRRRRRGAGVRRAPRSPQEEILCSLFAEVLGLERVGIDDNFFELGGHSLLGDPANQPHPCHLGCGGCDPQPVRGSDRGGSGQASCRGAGGAARAGAPAASGRDPALVWRSAGCGSSTAWRGAAQPTTSPLALRLTGALDRAALEAALADLVERHESLRTVFPDTLGVPRQLILEASAARPRLEVVSVSEQALPEALAAAARYGFDLSAEPPLRAHLFVLGANEHVLLLLLHHIASDGWSSVPLARDLRRPMRRAARVMRRSCRPCRCNMPTTRCG